MAYKSYDNTATVGSTLTPLGEIFILLDGKTKLTEFMLSIRNQGSSALNAFELRLQSSPRGAWEPWQFSWTAPASGSILVGTSDSEDPSTLASGESIQFLFDRTGPIYAIQAFASYATGSGAVEYGVGAYGA